MTNSELVVQVIIIVLEEALELTRYILQVMEVKRRTVFQQLGDNEVYVKFTVS
jgi:hypothetical protein